MDVDAVCGFVVQAAALQVVEVVEAAVAAGRGVADDANFLDARGFTFAYHAQADDAG